MGQGRSVCGRKQRTIKAKKGERETKKDKKNEGNLLKFRVKKKKKKHGFTCELRTKQE